VLRSNLTFPLEAKTVPVVCTYRIAGHSSGKLSDRAATKCLPLPLRGEQAQFLAFLVRKAVAVAHLVVMGRELVQQLSHTVPFANRVHVRNLVLRKRRKIHVHLRGGGKKAKSIAEAKISESKTGNRIRKLKFEVISVVTCWGDDDGIRSCSRDSGIRGRRQ